MPKQSKHFNKNEKGTAMALALLLSVILLGLGLALVFLAQMEQLSSNYAVQGSQAFYPADVEQAYLNVGKTTIGMYADWSTIIGQNQADAVQNCTRTNVPNVACSNEIAMTYQDLQGPWCKGRILRVPPDTTWDMSNAGANPFRLRCAMPNAFCNCQLILLHPDGSETGLPQRVTLYARNDLGDNQILVDGNGDIQLVAVSQMPSIASERLSSTAIIAYDLTAWSTEGLTYDIHQTGSVQRTTAP